MYSLTINGPPISLKAHFAIGTPTVFNITTLKYIDLIFIIGVETFRKIVCRVEPKINFIF